MEKVDEKTIELFGKRPKLKLSMHEILILLRKKSNLLNDLITVLSTPAAPPRHSIYSSSHQNFHTVSLISVKLTINSNIIVVSWLI